MKLYAIMILLFGFLFQSYGQAIEVMPSPLEDLQTEAEIAAIETQLADVFSEVEDVFSFDRQSASSILSQYRHLDPQGLVPDVLLTKAILYYHANKSLFSNKAYFTVVDFSIRSNLPRLFVIHVNTGRVRAVRTAHGVGSDRNNDGYAESLGNVPNSKKSSRGFYRVSETYNGKYGRSLRLDGLSRSNSKARSRAIVIHGGNYIKERNVAQGRSWGCFTLAWSVKDQIVDQIKNGSFLYADWSHNPM